LEDVIGSDVRGQFLLAHPVFIVKVSHSQMLSNDMFWNLVCIFYRTGAIPVVQPTVPWHVCFIVQMLYALCIISGMSIPGSNWVVMIE